MAARRALLVVALALGGAASGACASLVRDAARASTAGAFGLPAPERRLRDALTAARWDVALRAARSEKDGAPSDRLLRDLYAGTAAYYAGRWEESTAAFDRAAALADDRYTRSASRGALALATSDLALPYVPGDNERLLVHYYALLAWLRRGSLGDAAVEARRLGALLERADTGPLDRPTRAVLRYVAGTVFLAAGDTNDAAVAFRHAHALAGADTLRRAPRPARRAAADSGDVLVVVEQGFVAHRVEQRLVVRGAGGGAWGEEGAIARAASLFTGDVGLWAHAPAFELATADRTEGDSTPAPSHGPPMRLVWPAFRRPVPTAPASLVIDSAVPVQLLRADLSAAAAGDFGRDRGARLARLLARAALREGAASGLERKHGDLASLVRTVGRAVERADTRSWHLLPGAVGVTRLRLPVGAHALTVDVNGARVPLGTVEVRTGGLALAATRLWTAPRPDTSAPVPVTSAAR